MNETNPQQAVVAPLERGVGRLPDEGTGLWSRPTVEQAFAELLALDEQCRQKIRDARKAFAAADAAAIELAEKAAYTVRISIMQRDNTGAELHAGVAAALPIVREYARHNPCWTDGLGVTQDPNGAHAWLARHEPPNVRAKRV